MTEIVGFTGIAAWKITMPVSNVYFSLQREWQTEREGEIYNAIANCPTVKL